MAENGNGGVITMSPSDFMALIAGTPGLNTSGTLLTADDEIKYHDDPSIVIPRGMDMEHLSEVALRKADELNMVHSFTHNTKFRPDDGANAVSNVIKEMFGLSIGKDTRSMFGINPPEYRMINVDYGKKKEVPWGAVEIPALPGATFYFGHDHGKNGPVFQCNVRSPKKHKPVIEDFFRRIDAELAHNSIYRGKPLHGAYELSFMDVSRFKSNEIVFADDVQNAVDASINSLIEHTTAVVEAGLPTKRAVLAYGPYGTGKSSLGLITAQKAKAHGFTFLSAKAGKEEIGPVMQTAELYEPAVVFIEDIDNYTPKHGDKNALSEMLDLFDGIGTKNSQLLVIMTTNHIEQVPAGMLRPGRLDYCIEISGLDRNGTEKLLRAVIRHDLLANDVDFDTVYEEMTDWQPAWVKAVADRAQSFAIARTGGKLSYGLSTEDLVGAARSLKPQLEIMKVALEGYVEPDVNTALGNLVKDTVEESMDNWAIVDRDDDKVYEITRKPEGIDWMAET